jgi:hypothetical protein
MTSIAATGSAIPQPSPASPVAASLPVGASDTASAAASTRSEAVVISLSPGALTAAEQPGDKAAAQRVNSLVEAVKTHNDIADLNQHVAWSDLVQKFGEADVARIQATTQKYLAYSAARIGIDFAGSGISVQTATDQQVAETGVAPGTLLVKKFSFQAGGSTYAITAGEDGTLVGTRDGQAWRSWKTIPSHTTLANNATVALATLQGLISPDKAGETEGSPALVQLRV